MIVIEIEYPSLAEARERGPHDILDRARAESLRLLEAPTYCERDGRGVLSVAVDAPRPIEPAPVGSDDINPRDNDEADR